jgi:hypothetical protein
MKDGLDASRAGVFGLRGRIEEHLLTNLTHLAISSLRWLVMACFIKLCLLLEQSHMAILVSTLRVARRAFGRLAHQAALGDPTSSTNSVLTPFVALFDLPHRCRW